MGSFASPTSEPALAKSVMVCRPAARPVPYVVWEQAVSATASPVNAASGRARAAQSTFITNPHPSNNGPPQSNPPTGETRQKSVEPTPFLAESGGYDNQA